MAAISLQQAYDCVVIGSGKTAGLIAAAVARTGRQTLQLSSPTIPRPAWLHPRWTVVEGEEQLRSPLSGVSVVNAAGKRTTVLRAATSSASAAQRLSTADSFALPAGCQLTCHSPRELHLNGALPPTSIRAELIVAVEQRDYQPTSTAIGGIYRDVACDLGEERQALLFATLRASEVFWLVPLADGQWSLGLLTSAPELSAEDSIADVLEEALVACPALTQRLISAELLGSLHLSSTAAESAPLAELTGAIHVPEYDGWIDPVFASSDWLSVELASQIALHLPAGTEHWLQDWPAVEQFTSERIAPWYRAHEALPAALQDHAQRSWYEKLLAGQRARAAD
ncbi:hypothetical protein [Anatilimnocola floriformis]|uniref:hypothetical protein n=1 Tax=Anatilimnocola floriformis TaxID=2948575 RepID=UPI0020C3E104|nr:hypothetical protein [Anatilimnocola floriformis]